MIFSVRRASFGYRARPRVLRDICFSVETGQALAILGPNGAGKTTLLKCMMGLLNWREGASEIDGAPIQRVPHRELWRKIAYVPQAKNSVFSFTAKPRSVPALCCQGQWLASASTLTIRVRQCVICTT